MRRTIPNKRCRGCRFAVEDNSYSELFCWKHRKPFDSEFCRVRGRYAPQKPPESRQDDAGEAISEHTTQDKGGEELDARQTISAEAIGPETSATPPATCWTDKQLNLFKEV